MCQQSLLNIILTKTFTNSLITDDGRQLGYYVCWKRAVFSKSIVTYSRNNIQKSNTENVIYIFACILPFQHRIKRCFLQANPNHVSVSIFRNVRNVTTTHIDLSCFWFQVNRLHLRIHFSQSYAPGVFSSSASFCQMNVSSDDVSSNTRSFSSYTLRMLRHICTVQYNNDTVRLLRHVCTVHDSNDTVRLHLTKYV